MEVLAERDDGFVDSPIYITFLFQEREFTLRKFIKYWKSDLLHLVFVFV